MTVLRTIEKLFVDLILDFVFIQRLFIKMRWEFKINNPYENRRAEGKKIGFRMNEIEDEI
jgi:hypothetical protein